MYVVDVVDAQESSPELYVRTVFVNVFVILATTIDNFRRFNYEHKVSRMILASTFYT